MRDKIEAKLAQAEAQLPQWQQRLAEAQQVVSAASEQIVRWQAVAQCMRELLAESGPETCAVVDGAAEDEETAAYEASVAAEDGDAEDEDERQLQKDKVRLVQEMKI